MARAKNACIKCKNPEVEIVAHGLCAKCYMSERRKSESFDTLFGRLEAERHRRLTKLIQILNAVDDVGLDPVEKQTIRAIIKPYIAVCTEISSLPDVEVEQEVEA